MEILRWLVFQRIRREGDKAAVSVLGYTRVAVAPSPLLAAPESSSLPVRLPVSNKTPVSLGLLG